MSKLLLGERNVCMFSMHPLETATPKILGFAGPKRKWEHDSSAPAIMAKNRVLSVGTGLMLKYWVL